MTHGSYGSSNRRTYPQAGRPRNQSGPIGSGGARIDTYELEARHDLFAVAQLVTGDAGAKQGAERVYRCPFGSHKRRKLTVNLAKGLWRCFSCDKGGKGVISLVMAAENLNFRDACQWLGADLSSGRLAQVTRRDRSEECAKRDAAASRLKRQETRKEAQKRADALSLWADAHRLDSGETAAGRVRSYLSFRGLRLAIVGPYLNGLRGLERCPVGIPHGRSDYLPAMVGGIQRPISGYGSTPGPNRYNWPVVAIHRTFLEFYGNGRADIRAQKQMLGSVKGGAIRFGPPRAQLYLAEGVETSLSVLQALLEAGRDPSSFSVWAVLSLSGFGSVALPEQVQSLVLCADNDMAAGDLRDPKIADKVMGGYKRHQEARGRSVRISAPPVGKDFNDLLVGAA